MQTRERSMEGNPARLDTSERSERLVERESWYVGGPD